jgi:hypothetical protein
MWITGYHSASIETDWHCSIEFLVVVIIVVIIVVFIHLCDTHPIQKNLRPEGKTHGKFQKKIYINKKKLLFCLTRWFQISFLFFFFSLLSFVVCCVHVCVYMSIYYFSFRSLIYPRVQFNRDRKYNYSAGQSFLILLVGLFFLARLCLLVWFVNHLKKTKPLSAFSKANSPTANSLKAFTSSVFLYLC